MKNTKKMVAVMGVLAGAFLAEAHLKSGSLSPKGGETLAAGSTVNVKWAADNTHAPYSFDINLSTNGGASFEKIDTKTFSSTPGEYTFSWVVPNKPTETAQIQICQYDGTAKCNSVYTLKSANFKIEASTSLAEKTKEGKGPALRFDDATRNLEVSFFLDKEQNVSVQAFDTQGKLMATLLERRHAAGAHKVSIFSNGLDVKGPLVFQMRIGDKAHSISGNAGR